MQWIISAIILVAAVWFVPASARSMKASRKGRLGDAMSGIAGALDPARVLIVEEMEKRQKQDAEEADGDEEPLPEVR